MSYSACMQTEVLQPGRIIITSKNSIEITYKFASNCIFISIASSTCSQQFVSDILIHCMVRWLQIAVPDRSLLGLSHSLSEALGSSISTAFS
jgi:hypothetical protein